jgi:hypothetical protein
MVPDILFPSTVPEKDISCPRALISRETWAPLRLPFNFVEPRGALNVPLSFDPFCLISIVPCFWLPSRPVHEICQFPVSDGAAFDCELSCIAKAGLLANAFPQLPKSRTPAKSVNVATFAEILTIYLHVGLTYSHYDDGLWL